MLEGVAIPFLLQGIFPTQGLNPVLLHCRQILYRLSHWGNSLLLLKLTLITWLKECLPCFSIIKLLLFLFCSLFLRSKLLLFKLWCTSMRAFQVALVAKNPPANAGDIRDADSIPGSGKSPGGGHGNPLQYSCLENPMDRGTWQATVHRVTKNQTRLRWLSTHALFTISWSTTQFLRELRGGICLWKSNAHSTWKKRFECINFRDQSLERILEISLAPQFSPEETPNGLASK